MTSREAAMFIFLSPKNECHYSNHKTTMTYSGILKFCDISTVSRTLFVSKTFHQETEKMLDGTTDTKHIKLLNNGLILSTNVDHSSLIPMDTTIYGKEFYMMILMTGETIYFDSNNGILHMITMNGQAIELSHGSIFGTFVDTVPVSGIKKVDCYPGYIVFHMIDLQRLIFVTDSYEISGKSILTIGSQSMCTYITSFHAEPQFIIDTQYTKLFDTMTGIVHEVQSIAKLNIWSVIKK